MPEYVNTRALLRTLAKRSTHTLRRIGGTPSRLYVKLYILLRLNRVFHGLGLSGLSQVRLIPRHLPVSRRLMKQPYWVRSDSIRWGGRPLGGEARKGEGIGRGLVFGGDWDIEDKRDIAAYLSEYIYSKSVYQVFCDNTPYDRCDQYLEMSSFVQRGLHSNWQARGCKTQEDVDGYFEGLRKTFEAIQAFGYQSQEQLGSADWFDEIKVFVDRQGEIHKQQAGGHHRLAMVKILQVPKVPVLVLGVHKDWALRVQRERGRDVLSAIDEALQEMSPDGESGLDGR